MTECYEVAANMRPPRFAGIGEAFQWVKEQMPDETMTVRDNVAEVLYLRQKTEDLAKPVTFKVITEARYDDMLGCVPPAVHTSAGFLVGEPNDDHMCTVTQRYRPDYAAFFILDGVFLEASRCLTKPEFAAVTREDLARR